VIVPHGVLFRGGQEGAIRERLIEQNLLDLVVGLPPNLFYGTGIPAAILVFDKARAAGRHPHGKSVLFIDASREFEDGTNQNRLRTGKDGDVERIVSTYKAFKTVDKYAYKATFDEIKENDFNLNIPRYVDTFEEEVVIDISKVQEEIRELESKLTQTQKQMAKYMKELGYGG
jgi:type I restriction enzyme M protein